METRTSGRLRLAARRQRVELIRSRVTAFALAVFFGAGAVIGGRLALGHDPALRARTRSQHVAHRTATASSSPAPSTGEAGETGVVAPSPVTTSQS